MTVDTVAITRKTEEATSYLAAVKSGAAKLAADSSSSSEQWASFANAVAKAEGAAQAWSQLKFVAEAFMIDDGRGLTKLDVKAVAFGMLTNGADDTWSGRGNDVKRAHFDGIRQACSDMQWL